MTRRLFAVVCAFFLAAPLFAGSGSIEKKERKIPNRYLVLLDDSLRPDAKKVSKDLADKHGITVISIWEDALRGFAMEATEKIAEKIAADPRVLLVEEDQEIELSATCYVECVRKQTSSACADGKVPWQLDRIDQRTLPLNNLYTYCHKGHGEGVKAYVIDTGIAATHTDFSDGIGGTRVIQGRNFSTVGGTLDTNDCNGHGTFAASLLAGVGAGVAKKATIVPVKVVACPGGSNQTVVDGVNWVTQDHAAGQPAVANISLQAFGGTSTMMDIAVNNLVNDGVFVSVGAGNNNSNACNYSPGRAANAFTVGATTKTDAKSSYSNHGSCVAMWAPGGEASQPGQQLGVGAAQFNSLCCLNCNPGWSGTSAAAPVAAGVAAIIYQAHTTWTPAQIKAEMISRSTKNVITGLPSGTQNNRLLYANEPSWCQPHYDICVGPCPES